MKQITAYACDSCRYVDVSERNMTYHEQEHERERTERIKRESTGQLTIGQIIEKGGVLPDLPVVVLCDDKKYDGAYPSDLDSYRGYYDELAIDISRDEAISLSAFLKEMKSSLNHTYSGYRGGDYGMHKDTFVWLAGYGDSTNVAITDVRLSPSGETVHLVATRLGKEW